jgi:hypothetical protein
MLTPIIGGKQANGKIVASAVSPTFARSPLLVVRSASSSSNDRHAPGVRPDRPSNVRSVVGLSALVPQPGNLFVHHAGEARSRGSGSCFIAIRRWSLRILMGCGGCGEIRAADGKIKAPTFVSGMWLVGLRVLGIGAGVPAGAYYAKFNEFNASSAISHRFPDVDGRDGTRRRDQCSTRSHPARKPGRQISKELRESGHAGRPDIQARSSGAAGVGIVRRNGAHLSICRLGTVFDLAQ